MATQWPIPEPVRHGGKRPFSIHCPRCRIPVAFSELRTAAERREVLHALNRHRRRGGVCDQRVEMFRRANVGTIQMGRLVGPNRAELLDAHTSEVERSVRDRGDSVLWHSWFGAGGLGGL